MAERYRDLKDVLSRYAAEVARIRDANPRLAADQPTFFVYLCLPWIIDLSALTDDQKAFAERRKVEIVALGFPGEAAEADLQEILAQDKHLSECCPTLLHLAAFVDTFFIAGVVDAIRKKNNEQLEFAFDEFESVTYRQGRFRRIALSHLFNFEMQGDSSTFGDIRVERLDPNAIPTILGEFGYQAFLHPVGIGDCFVVQEEGASSTDDLTWIVAKHEKAFLFTQVLQYFKDGVVHLGYSVPFFHPHWANQIRRQGLFFLGKPRREPYEGGRKPFFISDTEKERLRAWWTATNTPRVAAALNNRIGKLREASYRAGTYYEASHERSQPVERLIALAIALESLFSPSDQGELRFRIAQSAAQFLGKDAAERREIFESLYDMYNRRSKLFHGSYDIEKYERGTFVTAAELDKWAAYLRRAVLGFFTLHLRGKTSRDSVLKELAEANFDQSKGEALRNAADIDKFFDELLHPPDSAPTAGGA